MSSKKPYNFLNLKVYPNKSLTLITFMIFFIIFSSLLPLLRSILY